MTVRALVVDDSRVMRAVIARTLSQDDQIEVVGTAENTTQARDMIKQLDPDVLTLDVEMPGMNGLDFLEKIMTLRPMPVVMLSSLTSEGAETSLKALELGAFDCFAKPSEGFNRGSGYEAALAEMVKSAAKSRQRARNRVVADRYSTAGYQPRPGTMIAIGSSTGGVEAQIELLSGFPENCPPTVIVQHMPGNFTGTFAARLNRMSRPTVSEARHGAPLQPGHVYVAQGGANHLEIAGTMGHWHCRLVPGERFSGHRPSVDKLFHSVARVAGKAAVGAILTGMGSDGAEGMKAMHDKGSVTIGQDEESCVVYGMPAVAFQIGAVTQQLPLTRIAARLLAECRL